MSAMRCPECDSLHVVVYDSRSTADNGIRRRRRCHSCQHRFTTYEAVDGVNQARVSHELGLIRVALSRLEKRLERALREKHDQAA